jgi:hypothetical protein
MFRISVRRLISVLFVFVVAFGMLIGSGQSAAFESPGTCDFQNQSCLAACPINPSTGELEEVCATNCRFSKTVCENDVFGANLSPDNFLLPLSLGCEKFYLSYKRNCTLYGGMIPRHVPVYDACITSGFSVDECCTNLANDFSTSISQCNEF